MTRPPDPPDNPPFYTIAGMNRAWRAAYARDGGEFWPRDEQPDAEPDTDEIAGEIDPCAVPRTYPKQLTIGD